MTTTPRRILPKLGASDRVTLYMSLVPYLLEHSPISVTDAASDFRVDPSELRDVVSKLVNLGVPGTEGFYLPNDLFEIDFDLFADQDVIDLTQAVGITATPRFSGPEAATLVAGLQFISGVVAAPERPALEALIEKIALGASREPSNIFFSSPPPPVDLVLVRAAMAAQTQLQFHYRNARGESELRAVDPIRLDLIGDTWYLRAWCHLRDALRTFRLDRVSDIAAIPAAATSALSADDLPEDLFDAQDSDLDVLLQLDEKALPLIAEFQPQLVTAVSAFTTADGTPARSDVRVSIRFANAAGVARLVASYPGVLRVMEPPEAVDEVARFAATALARYALPKQTRS